MTAPLTDRERVVLALSVRDAAPECAAVEALVADPVAVLLDVVANVSMPPTVPMRAAACLLDRHPVEAGDAIVGWMGAASTQGLAKLAASRIDALPADLAARVARAGLDGENADVVRAQVERFVR